MLPPVHFAVRSAGPSQQLWTDMKASYNALHRTSVLALIAILLTACGQPAQSNASAPDDGRLDLARMVDVLSKQLPLLRADSYDEPHGPRFEGQYAADPAASPAGNPDGLVVVTYNIKSGLAVDRANQEFQAVEKLRDADIVLLQEMEESGVELMAEALHYNYVYYPASSRRGRNMGNAILSRWPLTDTRKVILPHPHPVSGQMRIAVRATVQMENEEVLVYSVHTMTYPNLVPYRDAQVAAVVEDIGPGDMPVIAGGDFNTVSGRSIQRMIDQFSIIGLARTSAGAGPTIAKFGIRPAATDHIFTRGFSKIASGKVEDADASDHFPVWVQLAVEGYRLEDCS